MKRRVFFLIFAIGILLRVYYINVPPLWYDENFTLLLARSSFRQMIDATMGDVHPPLWYLIEWALFHLVPNAPAWAVRIPALIFSIATLPMYVMVMRQLGISPKVTLAAFCMLAVLPFQLWYAQEGRMYAMLEFLVLFTLWSALTRKYILLFIGSLMMLYTQNYGAFYIAAIALTILFRERSYVFNWHMSATISAVVLWLPWLSVIVNQAKGIDDRYWIVANNLGSILTILYKLFFAASVPSDLFFASYMVVFSSIILGSIAFIRSRHPARLTVAIMVFVPLLIAWIITILWQPILLFRAFIGISPFIYILTAWSFEDDSIKDRFDKLPSVYPSIARSIE